MTDSRINPFTELLGKATDIYNRQVENTQRLQMWSSRHQATLYTIRGLLEKNKVAEALEILKPLTPEGPQ